MLLVMITVDDDKVYLAGDDDIISIGAPTNPTEWYAIAYKDETILLVNPVHVRYAQYNP